MIKLFKRNRTFRLRAIRAYLVVILTCTLLLFCFTLISLYEQPRKVKDLPLQPTGKHIISYIEDGLQTAASRCLGIENMQSLIHISGDDGTPEKLRAYRKQFETLGEEHPVARSFFILDRNGLVFPRLSPPRQQDFVSLASPGQHSEYKRFSDLLSQGDYWENDSNQPARAIDSYRLAENLEVTPRLKALALYRAARALRKAKNEAQAVEAYQRLVRQYGGEYDESGVPYSLAVAAEPAELTNRVLGPIGLSTGKIYEELIDGEWELSGEQVDQYTARLEQLLNRSARERPSSDFLYGFELAKAVEENLDKYLDTTQSDVTSQSFRYEGLPYQTYQVLIPSDDGRKLIVGFSLSLPWIENTLLTAYLREFEYEDIVTASVVVSPDQKRISTSDSEAIVPFSEKFPYLSLHISPVPAHPFQAAANRQFWYIGLATVMLLCAMGLGLKLLIQVSWDIRWFQLRSDFVSGVSHEFKTPLSLIRLYSETLASADQEFSAEDRTNYVRIIARESDRMSRMLDNVLSFANMEQGRRRYEMREGDIRETVTQIVNDYSEYLTWRGFYVRCSVWPQLPPVIFNPEQVSEVILNLLDNARKYSGKSRQIRVNVWIQNHEVIVEVRDYGIGIPSGERERIFQPFYRVSRGKEHGGCGLGLYLVDQVMREHGGRVEVESEINNGSRFRLIFPEAGHKKTKSWKKKSYKLTEARLERQL